MSKNKNKRLIQKPKRYLALLITLFIIVPIVFTLIVTVKTNDIIEDEIHNYVIHSNYDAANVIHKELMTRKTIVESIADDIVIDVVEIIDELDINTIDFILNRLRRHYDYYDFYDMRLVDKEGNCYLTTDEYIPNLNVKTEEYFVRGFNGETVFTEYTKNSIYPDIYLNEIITPLTINNQIEYLLVASFDSTTYTKTLDDSIYPRYNKSFILNTQGSLVSVESDKNYLGLADYINTHKEVAPNPNGNNLIVFYYENEKYIANMTTLHIEDWYLCTTVKEQAVYNSVHEVNITTIITLTCLWLLIIVFMGTIYLLNNYHLKQLSHQTFNDDVINVPNYEYLKAKFNDLSVHEKRKTSIVVFDIDNFREINHVNIPGYGDTLLRYIHNVVRTTFPNVEIYRRYADNFVLAFYNTSKEEIIKTIEKLLEVFRADISNNVIDGFTLSFGICVDQDEENLNVKYINAMVAKSTIKVDPRVKYAVYDDKIKEVANDNIKLENAFVEAINHREFKIYYQPKYDMRNNKIIGSEALLRWIRQDGEIISPARFIPCYEKSGQIMELDMYVIDAICSDIVLMQEQGIEIKPIALNVSRLSTFNQHFASDVKKIIEKYQIDPKWLVFEVTESAFYDNEYNLNKIVEELHEMGSRVDMDDFGTGISSLKSLSKINFDTLKIDQIFTFNIGDNKFDRLVVSTIMLAKSLNMNIVAEGVETEEQRDFLMKNHCYYAQGYLYSKPLSFDDYINLIKNSDVNS